MKAPRNTAADETPQGTLIELWEQALPEASDIDCDDRRILYGQGRPRRHVYLVERGYVKLSRSTPAGDVFTHALLGPANLFGCLDDDEAASEVAEAAGPTIVRRCTPKVFERALGANPGLAGRVKANLVARMHELERRLEYVLFRDLRSRVAATLQDLISGHGGACRHGHMLDIRLTQQELAELVGASRQAVSGVLNELRRAGVIGYTRHFICVDDLTMLGRVAHGAEVLSSG